MWKQVIAFLVCFWERMQEERRLFRAGFWCGLGLLTALLFLCGSCRLAYAEVQIPRTAAQYRAELTRSARAVWGLDAPIAVFAAQVHTESWWRNDTVSSAGAQGLAQFMPSTAKWLPQVAPETGTPAPFNPGWSLRALCVYDKYLWDRVAGKNDYHRMAFTLSAYNGGLGWVQRDKRLAAERGLATGVWFEQVATCNAGRRSSAFGENRAYVRLILQERQQPYIKAGWGRGISNE